jgi:hypothetical protein
MSSSLINRKATKQFILGKIQSMRPHLGFTRVSGEVFEKLDAKIRAIIIAEIDRHPSVGKTFRMD